MTDEKIQIEIKRDDPYSGFYISKLTPTKKKTGHLTTKLIKEIAPIINLMGFTKLRVELSNE